jgi:hypothetical protein
MDHYYEEKISHLNDLIKLSRIDGRENLNEINFINSVADRLGISRDDLKEIRAKSNKVPFSPPDDMYQMLMQYHRLIVLMGIDRIISNEEKEFCVKLGLKLKLKKEAIHEIIDRAVDMPRHILAVDDVEQVFYRHYKKE